MADKDRRDASGAEVGGGGGADFEQYYEEDDATVLMTHEPATTSSIGSCTPVGMLAETRQFFSGLLSVFTPQFTAFVGLNYFFVKGMSYLAIQYVQLPFFKGLGASGSDYQKLYNVPQMAFALKPAFGVLSDAIPFFGYQKRYYSLLSCLIGAAAILGVVMLPDDAEMAKPAAALFFIFMGCIAVADLLRSFLQLEVGGCS